MELLEGKVRFIHAPEPPDASDAAWRGCAVGEVKVSRPDRSLETTRLTPPLAIDCERSQGTCMRCEHHVEARATGENAAVGTSRSLRIACPGAGERHGSLPPRRQLVHARQVARARRLVRDNEPARSRRRDAPHQRRPAAALADACAQPTPGRADALGASARVVWNARAASFALYALRGECAFIVRTSCAALGLGRRYTQLCDSHALMSSTSDARC